MGEGLERGVDLLGRQIGEGVYTYIAAPPNRVTGGVWPIFAEFSPRIGSRSKNCATFWKLLMEAFGYPLGFLV